MKRLIVCMSVLVVMGISGSAVAGNCYSDRVVKGWLEERDRAEESVVQVWARGASPDQFASEVAVILSNELYICSKCRNEKDFLKVNMHILGRGSDPKVENVPGIILERLIGDDILSPWKQFPSDRRRGMAGR